MNYFIDFMKEDIDAKKELLTSMPVKLKKDKIKYNEKIEIINNTYSKYKNVILKEMFKKYNKNINQIKPEDYTNEKKEISDEIEKLEQYIDFLNPINSALDKLSFDEYLFVLYNYEDYTFIEINNAIDVIITKLENVGVTITEDDFFYNYYVVKYMKMFLKYKQEKIPFTNLLSLFEEYYWHDSHLVKNIYLNIYSILRKYLPKLNLYIQKQMKNYDIKDGALKGYFEELKANYQKLDNLNKETVGTILTKFLNNELDINNYFENSKIRNEIFNNLQQMKIDTANKVQLEKYYSNLKKLEYDLEQYKMYYDFIPLINSFKDDFSLEIIQNFNEKNFKQIVRGIRKNENKLRKLKNKYNSKFYGKKLNDNTLNKINIQTFEINKEITDVQYEFFVELIIYYFRQYFDNPITIKNILNLYHTYGFYRLINIKRCEGKQIPLKVLYKKSINFNKFIINPNHELINVIPVFNEYDMKKIVIIKQKLNNLNVTSDNLDPELLDDFINNVKMLLRYKVLKDNNVDMEKISSIVKMNAILKKEKLIEETVQ